MIVTRMEPVTKTKYKIYIEEQFAFVLYKGELSRYGLREGSALSQELLEQIKIETLLKRAKQRALYLLNGMERTEEQLRTKLRQNLYPEDVVEAAIQYVKSFGYLGDEGYAERYIQNRMNSKSKKELYVSLCRKGVARETIENAMESCFDEESELEAIRRIVEKKRFRAEDSTEKEKKKICDYLLRKGFRLEDIRQVIQVSLWNA